jgi:tetratricopeptide (TPR) repeat protein
VQAVLDGRPIAARPIGPLRRAVRRWRRQPGRAAMVFGLLVLVPAVSLAGWTWWHTRADGSVGRSYLMRAAAAREVTDAFFAYKGGARAEAQPRFDAVLVGDPDHEFALLGRLLCALSADDGADLERVLSAHPAVVAAHPMFGWFGVEAARLQGRGEVALARAAQLPAEPPAHAVDWFVQGVLESWRGREGDAAHFTAALHAIEQAILLDRSDVRTPIFHVYAAETAALCGDRDVALRAARAIETLWPDSALALASAGRSLLAADGERSVALLTRARDLAPDRAVVQLYLAESLLFQDRADEASAAYEAALRLDDRLGSAWGGLCLLHLGQGRIEQAVACSARYVEVEPELGLAWKVRAQSLHLARRWREARDAYAKAVQRMPVDAVAHRGFAAVLDHLGETAAAAAERQRFAIPR